MENTGTQDENTVTNSSADNEIFIPEGFRQLQPVIDVTRTSLNQAQEQAKSLNICRNLNFEQTYERFWNKPPDNPYPIAYAVNPDMTGQENNLIYPQIIETGFAATPPNTNTLSSLNSRSAQVKQGTKWTLKKGVGQRFVINTPSEIALQYSNRSLIVGGTYGGVVLDDVNNEVKHGYLFAELFFRLHQRFPKIRLAKYVTDISKALRQEKATYITLPYSQFQIDFDIPTPVRSGYAYYISDLSLFWSTCNLESTKG